MATYAGEVTDTLTNEAGRPTVSPVTVYLTGTTTLAALFTDSSKSTPLANPLPVGVAVSAPGVDVVGNYAYWADPGEYDEWAFGAKIRKVTISNHPSEPGGGVGVHPDLAAHDALGLATQTELDAVSAAKAALAHSHAEADVTNLTADLAGKSASGHGHAEADVMNLAADLAAKAAKAANLSDLANAGTARTNLGLGTAATADKVAAGVAGVLDATDATTTNARTPTTHAASHKSGGSDAVKLNELAAPTAAVALNAQKITGLADGTAATDAAAFGQVSVKAADSAVVHNTGTETIAGAKTFSSDVVVPDEVYDATAWNGSLEVPTKNAVRDKIETLSAGGSVATDAIFDAKGDLPAGTGADAASRLAVGADGTTLVADSTQATGLAWKQRSRVISDVHADASIVNSAAAADLVTLALPTTLAAGDVVLFKIVGDLLNNTGAGVTYTWTLKIGATSVVVSNGVSIATTATRRSWRLDGSILVVVAASDQRLDCAVGINNTTANAFAITAFNTNNFGGVGRGVATEDLTAGKNLVFNMQLGTASASADFYVHEAQLEVIKK